MFNPLKNVEILLTIDLPFTTTDTATETRAAELIRQTPNNEKNSLKKTAQSL